ncbi:MAG: hypothetical protein KC502_01385 [Myxococcales bacterium]|nr:hypothetical protein [Myxococcales bacterium]
MTAPTASTRARIFALLCCAALGPWMMGALAASPSDQVEVSGQGGEYIFTPICSGQRLQVRHAEAQLRWTHRGQTRQVLGGTFVSHVDMYGSTARKTDQSDAANEAGSREGDEMWLLLRAQVGLDWSLLGIKVGAAGGRRSFTPRNLNHRRSAEPVIIPAMSLRLGPQHVHFRSALGDGNWQLRPTDLTFGIGLGDGGTDMTAPRDIRGFIGVGGDMVDASSDTFFYGGVRMNTHPLRVGVQGRVGSDGWAAGLWFGMPL